jgi:hypothetical protein
VPRWVWLLIVAAVLAAPFLTLGPQGGPLLRAQDLRSLDAVMRRVNDVYGTVLPQAEPVRAYKWRDSAGTWQYSSEPPPAGTDYEVVEVDPDANLMPPPGEQR